MMMMMIVMGRRRVRMSAARITCKLLLLTVLVSLVAMMMTNMRQTQALENGLARTPPMGWLAWTRFTCELDCETYPNDCIGEKLFSSMAETLVKDGYHSVGYEYVNIDDCWSTKTREISINQQKRLVANGTRFPNGIRSLANELHGKDLKLGIYGDCGLKTCAGYPAQLKVDSSEPERDNYFQVDADTLADWQVDALKLDGCYIDPLEAESICPGMSRALENSGRATLLTCEWPFYMMYAHTMPNFTLAAQSCNLWRYYDDIEDSWSSILNTVDYTVKHQSTILKYHGPGHWFDPDQLVIGNFGLSLAQARAQMALWSVWAAPLFMSNDLRNIDRRYAAILKNIKLIEVNQDRLGVWGLMVKKSDDGLIQAFVKPIEPIRNNCPSFAIVYFNRRSLGNRVRVSFKLLDLLTGAPIQQAARNQQIAIGESTINVSKCLERLAKSTSSSSSQSSNKQSWHQSGPSDESQQQRSNIEYDVLDLFTGSSSRISLGDELELMVEPSGVVAVRLREIE